MASSTTHGRDHRIIIGHSVTQPPRPPSRVRVARLDRPRPHSPAHGFIHHIIMLAQKVSVSAKTTAVVKTPVAKRGATIVRRNSKGGEEGARDFGNTYVLFFLRGGAGRRG